MDKTEKKDKRAKSISNRPSHLGLVPNKKKPKLNRELQLLNSDQKLSLAKIKQGRHKLFTNERIEEEALALIDWSNASIDNMWIQDFCQQRGYWFQRIGEFCKDCKLFSDVYKAFGVVSSHRVLLKGLKKEYDPSLVRFYLINKGGYISEATRAYNESKSVSDINITIKEFKE
jgi:hypothetical protein